MTEIRRRLNTRGRFEDRLLREVEIGIEHVRSEHAADSNGRGNKRAARNSIWEVLASGSPMVAPLPNAPSIAFRSVPAVNDLERLHVSPDPLRTQGDLLDVFPMSRFPSAVRCSSAAKEGRR